MTRRILIIHNPAAGKRRTALLDGVVAALRARGLAPEVVTTEGPENATDLVLSADADLVIAATCRPASLRACWTARTTSRAMPSSMSSGVSSRSSTRRRACSCSARFRRATESGAAGCGRGGGSGRDVADGPRAAH